MTERLHVVLDGRKARDFGIGRYVTGLCGGLARLGEVDLSVLVLPGDEDLFDDVVKKVPCSAPHYSPSELAVVSRAVRRLSPDVFHAPHWVLPLFPPRATVVTIHDLIHLTRPEHASPVRRLYARTMLGRAARLARRVVTVSRASLREIERLLPAARGKTHVVPPGLDRRFLSPPPARDLEAVRGRYSLDSPFVLFLGNDKPHKNLGALFDAFALLTRSRTGPLPRLVLAGGAPARTGDRAAAARARGVSASVLDLGVVADAEVPALLAAASVLVLPSLAEGFGLPVLEAQALGTPTVCSRRCGLPEAGGDAALYVDPESPAEIAEALARVLYDPVLRKTLAAAGRARVGAFTWEAAAGTTTLLYREAAAGGSP